MFSQKKNCSIFYRVDMYKIQAVSAQNGVRLFMIYVLLGSFVYY